MKETMNIAIVGHVDHGKSTILGRLLFETDSLSEGKLEQTEQYCNTHAKSFEYAYLIDALYKEHSQGITIDAARCFFRTEKRDYLFIDAPGHIEFIKNMVSGASHAEAALLVIDAKEGLQDNTLRHAFVLSFLQIPQVTVLINKMDQVGYKEEVYNSLALQVRELFENLEVPIHDIIALSGKNGDNIADFSPRMPWYQGNTLMQGIHSFRKVLTHSNQDLRLPIQDVYRFSDDGDERRILVGTIASGSVKAGDSVKIYPSQKVSKIATIESNKNKAFAGHAIGLTLGDPIFSERGEVITRITDAPLQLGSVFRVQIFWLGSKPLEVHKKYLLKIHTEKVLCQIQDIIEILDSKTLEEKKQIESNDFVECILCTDRPISCDLQTQCLTTSRFAVVDQYQIVGGGTVQKCLEGVSSTMKKPKVLFSELSKSFRQTKLARKSRVVFVQSSDLKDAWDFAKKLEKRALEEKVHAFCMGAELLEKTSEVIQRIDQCIEVEVFCFVAVSSFDLLLLESLKKHSLWKPVFLTLESTSSFHFDHRVDSERPVQEILFKLGVLSKELV